MKLNKVHCLILKWPRLIDLKISFHIQQTRVRALHPCVRSAILEGQDETDYKGFLKVKGSKTAAGLNKKRKTDLLTTIKSNAALDPAFKRWGSVSSCIAEKSILISFMPNQTRKFTIF